MEIETKKHANATVVSLTGKFYAVTAPEYDKRVRQLIDGGEIHLVIDFEELDYISSAGLRGLLLTAKLLKAKAGEVRCANIKGTVREIFDTSGFSSIFPMHDSVPAALGALP